MTRRFSVPPEGFDPNQLLEPVEILRSGGIVALPTETVYGLGASTARPDAVERLAALKERPQEKPFTYHLSGADQISKLVPEIPPIARALMGRYVPGPLTLILPAGAGQTIGVRVPANEVARKLIELVGAPLLVPSANPNGQPPALCADDVIRYFQDKIEAVVDGGTVLLKQASTVVRVGEKGYEVLREGIITREMIHQLIEGRRVLFVCTGNTCRSPMAAELYRKHLALRLGKDRDELNETGYRIHSAGTFAVRGSRPTEHAVVALREMDCDLSHHVSQPLSPELLGEVDHVYSLGRSHFQLIERMCQELPPDRRPRLDMLLEEGITDPVGGDLEIYRRCAREIEEAILGILPR